MPRTAAPSLTVVVLAAGLGKRMVSKQVKVLHRVAGRAMVEHVLDAARALRPRRTIVVVGHQADQVRSTLDGQVDRFVLQREQRGTGHAVKQAAPQLPARGTVLIVSGDVPTLRSSTLRRLVALHRRRRAALTLLTARVGDPTGYGRIARDDAGQVQRIVEHADATRAQRAIDEINSGIYCADARKLLAVLEQLRPDNAQGEYYITDAVHRLLATGETVAALVHDDAEEVLGVNNRTELARAGERLFARKAESLQRAGVTLLAPDRIWIDPRARIGRDTVIYPDVIVEGACVLGEDCVVRPGCRIVDSSIGRGAEIKDHTLILESRVGNDAAVGPFAHLRPGSDLGRESKVGNFVELKKARLGTGAKASHLSYLGDADIGAGSNIGAGTITCNYDGTHKHKTKLGPGVFIGSDTQLVAPVKLGKGAYVGAGTTVIEDVPGGALALSRAVQVNIRGWVAKRKARQSKKKNKN